MSKYANYKENWYNSPNYSNQSSIGFNRTYDDYDDWGSYNQTYKPKKEKKYQSASFNWNWSSFTLKEDDDSQLYTKEAESFFTPRAYDLERKFKYKLDDESANIVKDLSRMFYHKMMEETDYLKTNIDESSMDDKELEHYQKVAYILENSWDKDVPGHSPLEKAIFVYNELTEDQKGAKQLKDMSVQQLEQGFKRVEDVDRSVYEDKDLNEIFEMCDFAKNLKSNIFKKLSLIKHFGAKFKVEKEIKEKAVQNSKLLAPKFLEQYEQLALLDKYQYALPQFRANLALKNLNIRTPIDRTDHLQRIIIEVDKSGSMHDSLKQQWVCSILIDRMKYVVKGDAEIYFSYFVGNVHTMIHIKNREDVLKFWKNTYTPNPGGGGTDLGRVVRTIKSQIESGDFYGFGDLRQEKPEILVINDGWKAAALYSNI